MFEVKNDLDDLFKRLNPRHQVIGSLKASFDDAIYMKFLKLCTDTEITPDIHLFGYENALKENQYLAQHFASLSRQVWMIGCTGQGDAWFLDQQSLELLFYDHNLGFADDLNRQSFQSMNIRFFQFLQFALLLQELEEYGDLSSTDDEFTQFQYAVMQIESKLFSSYPFNYQ
ncbi:MAG: hypothetical protein GAK29_03240 [Acinetobacter bereziniae]|uniref:SMI1/KNR4 family protein n=1 Tax=Acinetobacter bereziniae TaxID=106648 RepID=A0A833PDN9_ACIBZ|nr:MAG: hypothetical protein GAK29_03240 [Acinetobacter bereziniae]